MTYPTKKNIWLVLIVVLGGLVLVIQVINLIMSRVFIILSYGFFLQSLSFILVSSCFSHIRLITKSQPQLWRFAAGYYCITRFPFLQLSV
jgi:hypothetical protein